MNGGTAPYLHVWMVSICILFIWSLCRTSLKLSTHFFSEEACYVSVTLTHILGLFFLPPCQTPVERCLALFSPGSDSKAIAHLPQKSPQNPKTKSTEREREKHNCNSRKRKNARCFPIFWRRRRKHNLVRRFLNDLSLSNQWNPRNL